MVRGGQLIKLAREARGMTQQDVAEALSPDGCARTVSRWETFKSEPRFCDVLNVIETICKMSISEVEELLYENNKRCAL